MENEENTRLRIHGRFMKKKVFLHRLKRVEMGRMCGKNNKTKVESVMKTFESSKVAEGNRVVNITYMAKNMKCNFCQENLLMMDIESEQISGLGSIFSIRCGKCLSLTEVPSSEQHNSPSSGYLQFDINSRVALDTEEKDDSSPVDNLSRNADRGWSFWGLVRAGWNAKEGTSPTPENPPIQPDQELSQRLDYVLQAVGIGRNYLYSVTAHTAYWTNSDVAYFVLTRVFPTLET